MKEGEHLKIYTDENVNIAIVEGLKRRGVEAWSMIFSAWLLDLKLDTVG